MAKIIYYSYWITIRYYLTFSQPHMIKTGGKLSLYWGQAKNSSQRKKSWQRKFFAKKRMQRKILLINPQFCTYFEEKLPIS